MKIIFAGTSHGVPEHDRFCSVTFVQACGNWYVIDAGGPVSPLLLRYGIAHREVRGIFITHLHSDHFEGLPEFSTQVCWYYRDAEPDIYIPEQRGVDLLRVWVDAMVDPGASSHLKLHTYENGPVYENETVTITAVPTKHTPMSHAFLFKAEGKTVLFTGDMSGNFPELPSLAGGEHCALTVCECAHITNMKAALAAMSEVDTQRMVLNHSNPVKLGDMEACAGKLPFPFSTAYDGMTIEI